MWKRNNTRGIFRRTMPFSQMVSREKGDLFKIYKPVECWIINSNGIRTNASYGERKKKYERERHRLLQHQHQHQQRQTHRKSIHMKTLLWWCVQCAWSFLFRLFYQDFCCFSLNRLLFFFIFFYFFRHRVSSFFCNLCAY